MQNNTLKSYRIIRDGDAPLRFNGRLIGSAEETPNVNGFVREVRLYRTVVGKFVALEYVDANFLEKPKRKAECFGTAVEAISWLRDPESGKLGEVAQDAISDAAQHDADVFAAFGELVP